MRFLIVGLQRFLLPPRSFGRSAISPSRALTFLAAGLLASCSSPPPPKPTAPVSPAALPANSLSRGMTTEEILQRIGKPAEVRPMKDHPEAQVWVYIRNLPAQHTMTATTTRDVPVVDPLTGAMKTQQELVYQPDEILRVQYTELLVMQNMLVSYKQYIETKHRYN